MRTRGRPRDAELDGRILRCAREIAARDGYGAVTVSGVARAAGLSRSTVYRRYPTLAVLRYAAVFVTEAGFPPVADTGDIGRDVRTHIEANASPFRDPAQRDLLRSVLVDAVVDKSVRRELAQRFTYPRLAEIARRIDAARSSGELAKSVDGDVLAKAVTGALLYHSVFLDLPVDDTFIDKLFDLVMADRVASRGKQDIAPGSLI